MIWHFIDRTAQRQHGLVTLAQVLDLGLTREGVRHAVRSRRLVRVRPAVFRLAGVPPSQDQAWLAAILATRGDAVLSHRSAAAAWRLLGFEIPDAIDLLVEGASRSRLPGVRAHRTQWLPTTDRTRLRRMPITTAERSFVDACGAVPKRVLESSLDDGLRRGVMSLPRIVRCFERLPVSGRRKSEPVRQLLAERVPGYDPGGSDSELDVMRVLRRAGIRPLPVQQHRVRVDGRTYFLDYAWPDTRYALEYETPAFHGDVSSFYRDRARTWRLQRERWKVWSVTPRTSEFELLAVAVEATTAEDAA